MDGENDFEEDNRGRELNANHSDVETEDPETFLLQKSRCRLTYSSEQLQKAVEAVQNGSIYSEAARLFKVPRRTISNRVKNKHSLAIGRPKVLNNELEAQLKEWIKESAAVGDPRTPKQIRNAAGKLCSLSARKFKHKIPARSFVRNFTNRNKGLSFRKPQSVTRAAATVTPHDIQENIKKVRSYLIENGFGHILNDPKAFGNGDETGYELNPVPSTVVTSTGSKAYRVEASKPKESVTVFNVILASGESLNPQIVLKESTETIVDVARACGEVGAKFVLQRTEKGWQTQKSFFEYITTKFVEELDEKGVIRRPDYPFVLFLDNHTSHRSLELFQWCKANSIVLATFYPNSTHISQPLDVGVFGAAKSVYGDLVQEWREKNRSSELKLPDFAKVLHEVQKKVFTEKTIKNAFRSTGVYPLNESNIHIERCIARNQPEDQTDDFSAPTEMLNWDENARHSFEDDSLEVSSHSVNEVVAIEDNSSGSPLLSVSEKLQQMERLTQSLEEDFRSDPDQLIKCYIIKQQLKLLSGSSPPLLSSTSSSAAPEPLTPAAIAANMLVRPTPVCKSAKKRNYKLKNYGVMTSDEVIGKHQEIADTRGKEAEEKENRRLARVQKQQMNETIRNIKKEKQAEKAQAGPQPKRRGRPPKNTKADDKDEDSEWQPKNARKNNAAPLSLQNL